MAAPNTNWVYERGTVSDSDRRTLEKAKRLEMKNLSNGHVWIEIDNITKTLVPCDEDGNPTKKGQEMIDKYKTFFM